jgi:hypothetical protein
MNSHEALIQAVQAVQAECTDLDRARKDRDWDWDKCVALRAEVLRRLDDVWSAVEREDVERED